MQLSLNSSTHKAQRTYTHRPILLVNLCCCLLLLVVTAVNVHRSLEMCCFGMTAPQLSVHQRLGIFLVATESSASQGQTPTPDLPPHCAICHTASQIVLFVSDLPVLLILVTVILLPLARIPRCPLLAPTPPPPQVAY